MAANRPPPSTAVAGVYLLLVLFATIVVFVFLGFQVQLAIISGVRAYVEGEGLWSKAQKDALRSLEHYAVTHDEADFLAYQHATQVPFGDRKARLELEKPDPDLAAVRAGFLQGRNHPEDLENMIWLFRRFRDVSYMSQAIDYWAEGDRLIARLDGLAGNLRREIASRQARPEVIAAINTQLDELSVQLTKAEDGFSHTLGEASRWVNGLVRKLNYAIMFLSALLGAGMSWLVIRRIRATEEESRRYAAILERRNRELQRFAQVASHDLQEPLRMISSYLQMIERRYKGKLDREADEYIGYAVGGAKRLQELIIGISEYYQVMTRAKPFQATACETVLQGALESLAQAIQPSAAIVTHDPLPTVTGDAQQLMRLFRNLLENAIVYRKPDEPPRIHISATRQGGEWQFAVRDNGIGFEPQYQERIFGMFQRLHGTGEYPGTGIGLAICKRIVEDHGGRIWAEAEPGKGATFYFTIPVAGA